MSSSKAAGCKNVPPPAGSQGGSPYARFIPREELGDFASWKPGTLRRRRRPAADAATGRGGRADGAATGGHRVAAARQAGYQDGYRDGLVALESFKQSFAQQATAQVGALLDGFDAPARRAGAAEMAQPRWPRTAVQLARQVRAQRAATRPELVASVARRGGRARCC